MVEVGVERRFEVMLGQTIVAESEMPHLVVVPAFVDAPIATGEAEEEGGEDGGDA